MWSLPMSFEPRIRNKPFDRISIEDSHLLATPFLIILSLPSYSRQLEKAQAESSKKMKPFKQGGA